MDILEFADKIFKEDPTPIRSIVISFDNVNDTKTLFEALITLFTEGMKILFGINGKVDLETICLDDFNKIVHYFSSMGIKLITHKFHITQVKKMDILNKYYMEHDLNIQYNVTNHTEEFDTHNFDIPNKELFINYKTLSSNTLVDYKYQLYVYNFVYIIQFDFI